MLSQAQHGEGCHSYKGVELLEVSVILSRRGRPHWKNGV